MILTPDQLRMAFGEATLLRFAHFNKLDWLPEWKDQKPPLPKTVEQPPKFTKPTTLRYDEYIVDRMENLRNRYGNQLDHISRKKREAEDPQNPDRGPQLEKVPNPWADVSHIDPGIFKDDEPEKLRGGAHLMRELIKFGTKDGEVGTELRTAARSLEKIETLLGDKPCGMQRLKLIFEWTLCHVTTLFGEINTALDDPDINKGKAAYNDARAEYIELLQDLDDGEPETKIKPPESARRGYGRVIKWVYFFPLIHTPDATKVPARIKGVVVVAKWNPHISSSGVPIAH